MRKLFRRGQCKVHLSQAYEAHGVRGCPQIMAPSNLKKIAYMQSYLRQSLRHFAVRYEACHRVLNQDASSPSMLEIAVPGAAVGLGRDAVPLASLSAAPSAAVNVRKGARKKREACVRKLLATMINGRVVFQILMLSGALDVHNGFLHGVKQGQEVVVCLCFVFCLCT